MAAEQSRAAPAPAAPAAAALPPSDADLVHAARSGDRAAWARLYERHAPMVHGVLLAHAGPDHADDLLHDVFVKVLRPGGVLDSLRSAGSIGPWLARIARRAALSRRRSAWVRRRVGLALADDRPAPAPRDARGTAAALDAHAVLDALARLPRSMREVLTLRMVEGLTGPQIAASLGMTHASVRVCLCRGMKRLKHDLGIEP